MNYLELAGTIIGLVYLWLEYKASYYLWIASLIMPSVYVIVYYQAGLYADLGINIYYVLASIYGLIYWSIGSKKSKEVAHEEIPVGYTPRQLYLPLLAAMSILTIGIAQILIAFTDSNVPWSDSFTTALSIVAMWMLSRKYVEQWLVWLVVDVVCSILYIYKGLYFTSGLYALYSFIAYFGYLKWKEMIKDQ